MKILVVDREVVTAEFMGSRLETLGHKVVHEPVKNNAIEKLASSPFDIVFFDPTPLTDARPLILNFRRSASRYPYIVKMGGEVNLTQAIQSGANDCMAKPIDPEKLDSIITNARFLTSLIERIGDEEMDFPSAGGIIAKSAFNQLFLSAIERADRYGERTFLVFIKLANYQEIYEAEGPYAADYAAAKLSKYLVRLRRQSDIIAQTDVNEFVLLLQRPLYESEPMDAVNRFAEAIAGFADLFQKDGIAPEISVTLSDLPVGSRLVSHQITREHVKQL